MPWAPSTPRRPDPSRAREVLVAALLVPLLALGMTAAAADEDVLVTGGASTGAPEAPPVAAAAPEPSATPLAGPPPSPGPSAAPPPSSPPPPPPAAPPAPAVVQAGDGQLVTAPGGTAATGTGPLSTYRVRVEGGIGVDPAEFAQVVDATLADPRSWTGGGRRSVARTDAPSATFEVVLASPDLTDAMCLPLRTNGRLSCASGSTAVLNSMRWLTGADAYAGDLAGYRQYLVNHEVGHTLGSGHVDCPGAGQLAPVMMQQTKGIGACVKSAWPFP